MRTSSTCTSTPTTRGRCSRWPATRARWRTPCWRAPRGRRASRPDRHDGLHPHVGRSDVMPVVYLDEEHRGAACAEALTAAALIGEQLGVPVFLYGELATQPEHAERADLRRGGGAGWASGSSAASSCPTTGRRAPSQRRGRCWPRPGRRSSRSTSTWRPRRGGGEGGSPTSCARSGGGMPGVRAIGLYLDRPRAGPGLHERPRLPCATPLPRVVEAVRSAAEVAEAELVGLAPRAAFEGFPEDVPPARVLARAPSDREGAGQRCGNVAVRGPDEEEAASQAPRHARRDDRAGGPHGAPAHARGGEEDLAPAAQRAHGPAAHLARLGEPGGDRRGGVRRPGRGRLRARARPGGGPRRCSCCCSTSRSATAPTWRSTASASGGRRRRESRLQRDGRPHVHRRARGGEQLPVPPRRLRSRAHRRPRRRGPTSCSAPSSRWA